MNTILDGDSYTVGERYPDLLGEMITNANPDELDLADKILSLIKQGKWAVGLYTGYKDVDK